jgi:hypothetical protein
VELVAERQPLAQFELDAAGLPYFAIKSKARSEPLWIGCQHSTGRRSGAGTKVISFKV